MEDYKKKYEDLISSLKKAKNDELVCDDRFCAVIDNIVPELKESEDEKIRKSLIDVISEWSEDTCLGRYNVPRNEVIAWLEKQKPVEWSEEDERMLEDCIGAVAAADYYPYEDKQKMENWLKSLKPYSKQEWSEGDEATYNKALDAYYYKDCNDKDDVVFALKNLIDLIKKHRKAIPVYQRWKPSEEQLKALKEACDEHWEPNGLDPLYMLWEQLKKLMEE